MHPSPVPSNSTTNGSDATKKHRHKHKCGEEFCKHRKHKKRRKHHKVKHQPRDETSQDGAGDDDTTKHSHGDEDDEEEEEEEEDEEYDEDEDEAVGSVEQSRGDDGKRTVKEEAAGGMTETEDTASNTNDSSGSLYVCVFVCFLLIALIYCAKNLL